MFPFDDVIMTLLYTDDTVVLAESAEELQFVLNAVHDYCNKLNLTVHVAKTKIVDFFPKKSLSDAFFFGRAHLEVVDNYTYLGKLFYHNGSFCKNINKQVTQG